MEKGVWRLGKQAFKQRPSPRTAEGISHGREERYRFFLNFGRIKSTLDPDTFEEYRDTPPISIAILCRSMPSWQKVVYTPPICITIRLPFVLRYFRRSIRVRDRWSTLHFSRRHPSRDVLSDQNLLGSAFGRADFFAEFLFLSRSISIADFVAGFSPHSYWKKRPEKKASRARLLSPFFPPNRR